ncbi:MAG: hypothetical protein ACOC35_07965, partial [Promethearchaeia archaeon]
MIVSKIRNKSGHSLKFSVMGMVRGVLKQRTFLFNYVCNWFPVYLQSDLNPTWNIALASGNPFPSTWLYVMVETVRCR